jgi:chromate transporter
MTEPTPQANHPTLGDTLPVYARIGLLSFGGPAGQIALMQEEIVARRRWIDGQTFQTGLNVAMLLPGPEAHQLVTWIGWRMHGLAGGLAAGLAFILPGAVLMLLLAWMAAAWGGLGWVQAIFWGLQPAVIVIVAQAVLKLARRSLGGWPHGLIAAAALAAIFLADAPFPLVVAAAAAAGFLLPAPPPGPEDRAVAAPRWHWLAQLAGWGLVVAAVYLLVRLAFGPDPWDQIAALFLSAALVTFGGAYAVLPYVADRAVETHGWLTAQQMLNGLALAESTPGPLILVNMYVGFFAGWPQGAGAAILAACLACVYTFAPSFALILACAPHVATMQRAPFARRALAGVSAAVVGVILNLAVWLALAAFFPGGPGGADWPKLALAVAFGIWGFRWSPPMTSMLAAGAAAGLAALALRLL